MPPCRHCVHCQSPAPTLTLSTGSPLRSLRRWGLVLKLLPFPILGAPALHCPCEKIHVLGVCIFRKSGKHRPDSHRRKKKLKNKQKKAQRCWSQHCVSWRNTGIHPRTGGKGSLGRKAETNLDRVLKSRDITLPTKVHIVKAGFSGSQVWMWGLDHKEGWAPKNWCFWTAVLEKILEGPLDSKEITPVNPKGNQPWIFIGRTDAEAEAPIAPTALDTCCKELTHWKRPWCWERLKVGGEGDNRGWDGLMASPTQWTWVSKLQELVMDREAWHASAHGVSKS